MADITWPNVLEHAAELSTVPAGAQTRILSYVNTKLRSEEFGGEGSAEFELARIYLAAHMGTVESSSAGGPVSSQKAGDLSKSYAVMMPSSLTASYLATTRYGRAYADMVRRSPARAPFAI